MSGRTAKLLKDPEPIKRTRKPTPKLKATPIKLGKAKPAVIRIPKKKIVSVLKSTPSSDPSFVERLSVNTGQISNPVVRNNELIWPADMLKTVTNHQQSWSNYMMQLHLQNKEEIPAENQCDTLPVKPMPSEIEPYIPTPLSVLKLNKVMQSQPREMLHIPLKVPSIHGHAPTL